MLRVHRWKVAFGACYTPLMKKMHDAINWFEIPVSDIDRATRFYEAIFDIEMSRMSLPNGLEMAVFPVEEGRVDGALCLHPDYYAPSTTGTLVYLNANPDLQQVLERVEKTGGKVIREKTGIGEEHGFTAVLEDTEGNRVALHSWK